MNAVSVRSAVPFPSVFKAPVIRTPMGMFFSWIGDSQSSRPLVLTWKLTDELCATAVAEDISPRKNASARMSGNRHAGFRLFDIIPLQSFAMNFTEMKPDPIERLANFQLSVKRSGRRQNASLAHCGSLCFPGCAKVDFKEHPCPSNGINTARPLRANTASRAARCGRKA
jgi:hypothetical protein